MKKFGGISMIALVGMLLALCLFLLPTKVEAAENVGSGTCGDNVTWILTGDGVLTISGEGAMADYTLDSRSPFGAYGTKIKKVIIENGITHIGNFAFYRRDLTNIIISNSVTSIGAFAFYECDDLLDVTIPDSVTSIGYNAFAKCSSLSSATIGSSVAVIHDYAFCECTNLTSIIIPDSVTSIGYAAFAKCTWLSSVTIGNGVTIIDKYAFNSCIRLSNITIGSSVTSIGNFAFYGCALTSITIPDSMTSIGHSAFLECSMLESITLPFVGGSATENRFLGYIFGANYAHENDDYVPNSLKTVNLTDACTSIANYSFKLCNNLRYINISDSVVSIDMYAFAPCDSLEYNVYENAYYLGNSTNPYVALISHGDKNSTSCVIHEDTKLIAEGAFQSCTNLTSVIIPDNVISVDDAAFSGCTSLTSVIIPDSVTDIGDRVFKGCSSLTSVTLPNSLTYISYFMFEDCTSLTSVIIPDSVTSIGSCAFQGCSSLATIAIPNTVTRMAYSVFENCTGLTAITIPTGVTELGNDTFKNCSSLTSITIPEIITEFGDYVFYDCTSLTEIYFKGNAPTKTGSEMFGNVRAKAYYPADNETWTEFDLRNHGGKITWVAYGHEHSYVQAECVEATCTENGYVVFTCDTCGDSYTETIVAVSHSYSTVVIEPTCTEQGCCIYTCDTCGDSYTEVLAVIGHSYCAVVTPPTCAEQGYTTHICNRCNDRYVADQTPAIGHSFGNWHTEKEATCIATGIEQRVCSNCKHYETREITALGHTPGPEANCTESQNCTICNIQLTPPTGHKAEIIPGTVPTCAAAGVTEGSKCSACGEILVAPEEISALGHQYNDGACTRCGAADPSVPTILPGDADQNGVVNYNDALRVLRASIKLVTLSDAVAAACDVDGNGKLDYNDALQILRASIGL